MKREDSGGIKREDIEGGIKRGIRNERKTCMIIKNIKDSLPFLLIFPPPPSQFPPSSISPSFYSPSSFYPPYSPFSISPPPSSSFNSHSIRPPLYIFKSSSIA